MELVQREALLWPKSTLLHQLFPNLDKQVTITQTRNPKFLWEFGDRPKLPEYLLNVVLFLAHFFILHSWIVDLMSSCHGTCPRVVGEEREATSPLLQSLTCGDLLSNSRVRVFLYLDFKFSCQLCYQLQHPTLCTLKTVELSKVI
jgi:hypothetical protein